MGKYSITEADFKLFTVLWNQQQNQKTPDLHLRMAHWLEDAWKKGDTRLLLMAFRSAGKSTMVGLFAAWLLYRDPNVRILVLAADFTLAKKMVRNVKRIIERHPLTPNMKPERADQWASDRFTVKRSLELRDPSMMAKGVTSNITGSRADVVICDDVEVPNTCDSAEKREELRLRLSEIAYVMVAGGVQLYVGTPHHYFSIYADVARGEIDEERPFLDGFSRLCLPILDDDGQSVWPERYGAETIAQIRRATGPNKFESQMMLKMVNIMDSRLNPDLLKFYNAEAQYCRITNMLYVGHMKMVSVACWWDPAFGAAKGDHSVVAIVFSDENGDYYLHHIEYISVKEGDDIDEATQQSRIVAQIAKAHHVPTVMVEANGIGKFLPGILRNELSMNSVPARVQEVHNTQNKEMRILEAFDGLMAAQRLYVHENVRKTPFLMEMREWRPSGKRGHDDGLDAVAGALSVLPDRSARLAGRGNLSWMRGTKQHKVKSSFDV